MNARVRSLIALNAIGGIAVLTSYALGLFSDSSVGAELWGGVPEGLRPLYTVNMFLYLDGTWTAHLTTDKNYNNPGIWLETALQKKINIHMCDRCSKARDLIPENILPNIHISGSYQLIELLKNSDQVLTFGG